MQISNEDLANMSPEQVASLQKQNCIFCHIISGKVSSKKVFEDEICMAILDINPANPGHVLVIPKEHYTVLPLIPEDVVQHMGQVTKYISQACLKVLKAQGTNIFVANGAVAGQKAPHFMFHIVPRRDGDDVPSFSLPSHKVSSTELNQFKEKLLPTIMDVLKCKAPEQKAPAPVQTESPAVQVEESVATPVTVPDLEKESLEESTNLSAHEDIEVHQEKPAPGGIDFDTLASAILSQPSLTTPSAPVKTIAETEEVVETAPVDRSSSFIASTQSNKVHAPNCPLAKKIKKENLVSFSTKTQAIDEGYEECDCVK